MTQITKAVFPVAGLGTRFLPATKACPKEMLPIVDKPLIQYAVEEAVAAGIQELIFVTSQNKRAIEDHFDRNLELEAKLKAQDKQGLLSQVQNILPEGVSCVYIRQFEPLGLGHAIRCAKPAVGNNPFAVILADDLIQSRNKACLTQMVEEYQKTQSSIVAVQRIDPSQSESYGIVDVPDHFQMIGNINGIVEKPSPDKAPSNLGVVGRYILTPAIFDMLENTRPGKGGEIQLTDAIEGLISKEGVSAYAFDGERFDCGQKLDYLRAIVTNGMEHPEMGAAFREMLMRMIAGSI